MTKKFECVIRESKNLKITLISSFIASDPEPTSQRSRPVRLLPDFLQNLQNFQNLHTLIAHFLQCESVTSDARSLRESYERHRPFVVQGHMYRTVYGNVVYAAEDEEEDEGGFMGTIYYWYPFVCSFSTKFSLVSLSLFFCFSLCTVKTGKSDWKAQNSCENLPKYV